MLLRRVSRVLAVEPDRRMGAVLRARSPGALLVLARRPDPPHGGLRRDPVCGPLDSAIQGRNDPRSSAVAACMTTVGFIGSGRIGSTVARLSVAAGHPVVLSNSRGPDTLQELVDELGPLATAATGAQAAAAGDIVVVTIPLMAYSSVPVEPLAGKVVIDTGNYYPQRDGQIADLDSGSVTSSELLQRQLPTSRVVKAFNNIFFKHLRSLSRPAGAADRTFLPIAGDDPAAKSAVTAFLDSIGYGAVDSGPLAEGWRQQPATPVYATPYGSFDDEVGQPAEAGAVRAALAEARR